MVFLPRFTSNSQVRHPVLFFLCALRGIGTCAFCVEAVESESSEEQQLLSFIVANTSSGTRLDPSKHE